MNRLKLKKGILYSVMWALVYQLNKQHENEPCKKIKSIIFHRYESYDDDQKDIFHMLRVEVWKHLEPRFNGDIDLPIMITELFWSFPDTYGKNIQKWIDKLDDEIISNIDYDELLHKSKEATEWYVELIDKVIFDYMKEIKDER